MQVTEEMQQQTLIRSISEKTETFVWFVQTRRVLAFNTSQSPSVHAQFT